MIPDHFQTFFKVCPVAAHEVVLARLKRRESPVSHIFDSCLSPSVTSRKAELGF